MTTDMQSAFEHWVTTVWRPDDGAELLKRDYPRMALAAWKAALASRPDAQADGSACCKGIAPAHLCRVECGGTMQASGAAQADERGAKLYRFIEAPEHILVGDEIWAQRRSEWQPVNPDFADTEYSNWMPPIRREVDQHEKSDLYKAGYLAGKKVAQESFSKLISCDPNDEALGLICEALALKPEGDITEAILGTIEELKTKVGIEAEAAQGVPENIEEGLEILDNFIANVREYGNYSAEATLTFIAQARQCFAAARSPDREQEASPSRECGEQQGAALSEAALERAINAWFEPAGLRTDGTIERAKGE